LFKNNVEDEADFCEAYKSQILNNDTEERESPIGSIVIILLLLAMIIALSIFGYNYIMETKSGSVESQTLVKSVSDDELKVTSEVVAPPPSTTNKVKAEEIKKTVVKSLNDLPKSESLDINDLADQVKIDMSENEEENDSSKESKKIEKTIVPVLTDSIESKYIEDLAKLTEEIDRERD